MIRSDNPEPEITIGSGLISPGWRMRDLVERARSGFDGPPYPKNLLTELADEIEWLRRGRTPLGEAAAACVEFANDEIERLRSALRMVVTDLGEGVDPQEVRACVLDVLNQQRSP
jgi:hypothetical protein